MWGFWTRHKRKVYVSLGVFGSGYLLYKLYDTHKKQLDQLEKQLASERESEQLVKAQMKLHFESIQSIADTTTLPHALLHLRRQVEERVDILNLTEKLMEGKGQPKTLTSLEKLELWDRLKIQSFTRTVLSIWAITALSLYIRVQVNILGRHLYIDTARGLGAAHLLDDELIDRNDQQQFLEAVDFLCINGMSTLISNMQTSATMVLKEKRLKDLFTSSVLNETIMQILDVFMSMGSPHQWVEYLMPEDLKYKSAAFSSNDGQSEFTKFDLLMLETYSVLSSDEFRSILDVSLKAVVDELVQDMKNQPGSINITGVPLAKLLPKVAHMGPLLLQEPSKNKFIHIVRNLPVAEVFFTLVYANTPPS
ncbi:peroxisome biogenesis protein 3-1-like [Apium graveolens]|uniref:peroxisome biogenesis protein 3-1-like n=1 Tax=Apium graveolens TaxID=4045 RepID=UPI003D7B2DCF